MCFAPKDPWKIYFLRFSPADLTLFLVFRARRRLPAGFEKVSIGNRMVGKLRELGIDYVEGRFEGTYDDDDEVD